MQFPTHETLLVKEEAGVLFITLNRPQVRNAMSSQMVDELMQIFSSIQDHQEIRAVVLRGAEGHFCAGGDVKDMSDARKNSEIEDPYFELNRKFGKMITLVNASPKAVITVLEGAVLGGGFGLACISDIAIAKKSASFGLPETGLGIPPAQIAPFVVQRIGLTQARRLGVLGARFNGEEALRLGVVHHVCQSNEEIDEELKLTLKQIRRCAPEANAITKKLMLSVGTMDVETLLDDAARDFSKCVQGPEGKEGMKAFIEKRKPVWMEGKL